MKKILLLIFIGFSSLSQTTKAQNLYFPPLSSSAPWDTTSPTSLGWCLDKIDTLYDFLQQQDTKGFINGPIDYGNGGHNHNASHWFLWHFIPNQWSLVELAIEVCDGCPYTDVDTDTAYWVGNIGQFCPWSGRPVREVSNPLGINDRFLKMKFYFIQTQQKTN